MGDARRGFARGIVAVLSLPGVFGKGARLKGPEVCDTAVASITKD